MKRPKDSAGFTVVELVVTIALLGILSVTVSSRWFGAEAFHGDSLKERWLAEARLAQRTALANSENDVALVVSRLGDEWRYQIFSDDGSGRALVRETVADEGGIAIEVSADSSQTLGTGVDFDLTYDGLGNLDSLLVGGAAQDPSSGIQVNLGNARLCLSPLGYAHDGDCV